MTTSPRTGESSKPAGLSIRPLEAGDAAEMAAAFTSMGWSEPAAQFERYFVEQEAGARDVLVAEFDGVFAGYVTVSWRPTYPPFRVASIPEIQDLNVLPAVRRRGIASRLLDEAESRIAERSNTAGIGFGLTENYGAAQRLYVRRGYVPDARGVMSGDAPVEYWSEVRADDDLVLYLTKTLRSEPTSAGRGGE